MSEIENAVDPIDAELDRQLKEAEALTFKLDERERERARKRSEIVAQYRRADVELGERLAAEADAALAEELIKTKGRVPLDAMWSIEAHKLCGIGWLVLGPGDHGYAIEAMKSAGAYDVDRKGVKVIESDVDVMLPVVQKGIVRAPIELKNYSDALTKAPHFVLACFRKIEELGASGAKEVRGKSKR